MENPNDDEETLRRDLEGYEEKLRRLIEVLIREGDDYYAIQAILNAQKVIVEKELNNVEMDIQHFLNIEKTPPKDYLLERERYQRMLEIMGIAQHNLIHYFDIFDDEDTNLHTEEESEEESEYSDSEGLIVDDYIDNLKDIFYNYKELHGKYAAAEMFYIFLQTEKQKLIDGINHYYDLERQTGNDFQDEIRLSLAKKTKVDFLISDMNRIIYINRLLKSGSPPAG